MSTRRVMFSLEEEHFLLLVQKAHDTGYTPSQLAKYYVLGELGLPRTEKPAGAPIRKLEDFVRNGDEGMTFYIFSPFSADEWWSYSRGVKRSLSWTLRRLAAEGYCEKTLTGTLPNGTNQYVIVKKRRNDNGNGRD